MCVKRRYVTQICYQAKKFTPKSTYPDAKSETLYVSKKSVIYWGDILKSEFLSQYGSRLYVASRVDSKLSLKNLSLEPY